MPHKKELCDEVLRKIGLNVLLFQQIEALLKLLVTHHRIDGTVTNTAERKQQRAEQVHKLTMGALVGQYTDNILSDAGDSIKEPEIVDEIWMSSTFSITGDSDLYGSLSADLKLMVQERNDLVHHFLPQWQPDSVEQMEKASSYLDQQREKVLPMFEHLKSVTTSMQDAQNMMASFLASDEGDRLCELIWLQSSPLVSLLLDVVDQNARPDGWCYLAHAGRLARIHQPDAVAKMKERYGHSTLKKLLIVTEFFDLLDEPTSNGGFATLYRVKNVVEQ